MSPIARFSAAFIVATVVVQTTVLAQGLEVGRHNPSEWTKGRFSEVVTVNGPGKTIYPPELARRMRTVPRAQAPPSCIPVTPMSSACRYAYDSSPGACRSLLKSVRHQIIGLRRACLPGSHRARVRPSAKAVRRLVYWQLDRAPRPHADTDGPARFAIGKHVRLDESQLTFRALADGRFAGLRR
jgi:hypothetical protein